MRPRLFAVLLLAVAAAGCERPVYPTAPSLVVGSMTLSASPRATVAMSGGSVFITARMVNTNGTGSANVPVTFSASSGNLSDSTVMTSSTGLADVTFTGAATSTITATGGGVTSAPLTITALEPFRLELIVNGLRVVRASIPVLARVVSFPDVIQPTSTTVTITCGGTTMTGLAVDCVFPTLGAHTIRATATTPNGWSTSSSVVAVIAPLTVSIFTNAARVYDDRTEASFTVPTLAGAARHHWTFDSDGTETTLLPMVTWSFDRPNRERQVSVRIEDAAGVTIATGATVGIW